jgi:hypothetical protein
VTEIDSRKVQQEVDAISKGIIDRITEIAGDDDRLLLRLLRPVAEVNSQHKERIMSVRDDAAKRLREAGVPMVEIADEAGVTDSYLFRQVIKRGSKRIKPRRRQRPAE